MNPVGMFEKGQRQRDYSAKDTLPLSGRLIPEFDGRRSIRDMFTRKPSVQSTTSTVNSLSVFEEPAMTVDVTIPAVEDISNGTLATSQANATSPSFSAASGATSADRKRPLTDAPAGNPSKKAKSGVATAVPNKGQQSLKGFFKPKPTTSGSNARTASLTDTAASVTIHKEAPAISPCQSATQALKGTTSVSAGKLLSPHTPPQTRSSVAEPSPSKADASTSFTMCSPTPIRTPMRSPQQVHDPVASAESWSKLFTKPAAPRCEGHDEPCITLLTKKSGMNCGRSFWMCPRPLGPSGAKEKNTQWRCQTFIWCSDWNSASSESR